MATKNEPIQTKAKLARKVSVGPASYLCTLEVPEGFPAPAPGQFVQVAALPELALRRPFSVAGYRGGMLELVMEVKGRGTRELARRPEGSLVDILGPLGNAFTFPQEGETAVMVAGGIGIAGLRYLAEKLLLEARRSLALVGDRTRDMLLDHLLPEAAGGGRYRIETSTDDGTAGFRGPVTGLLRSELRGMRGGARLYCCGPLPMIRRIAGIAQEEGLRCEALMEEVMACGVGACRGCVVRTRSGYRSACTDGPVFDTAELVFGENADG